MVAGSGFLLGDIEVTPITDIECFEAPLSFVFPDFDAARLKDHNHWLEPLHVDQQQVRLAIRSWLLRADGRTILIDAGVGNDKNRPNRPEWHRKTDQHWLNALSGAGLAPKDIDIVLCTHLHADHVGWNTRLADGRWVPTFPNARYIAGKVEYDHWQDTVHKAKDPQTIGHGCWQDSVLPVMEAGQMDLIEDGWELSHGLRLERSAGHTPGHLSLNVKRSGCHAIICNDVMHSPVQIVEPDWSSTFCTDPDLARETRKSLLERIADTEIMLVPAHFRGQGWCRVKRHNGAYVPVF
ncbi:MAG: MBL fold metallo-hydrolase [Pseudomonadota bacterium]